MSTPEDLTQARIDIARMEVQIDSLTQVVADLSADIKAMRGQMDEARGGWRTLMLVGGAASSMGAGLTWILQHFGK